MPPTPVPSLSDALTFERGPSWRNRLGLAPLTNKQSHADGTLSEDETRWLVARAEGGMGMVMTAAAYVTPAGKAWDGQLGVHDDAMLPGLTALATELRAAGAVSCVQLHHGGRRADAQVSGAPTVAPWDDPKTGARGLTTAEVGGVVADFVAAAVRSEQAGFDGVQVHGAHGYLVAQFMDTRFNDRTDAYGGSFENRSRVVREVVEGIRAATGPDFQVGLRISPERYGMTLADGVALARWALGSGLLDHLDVSLWDVYKEPHEREFSGSLLIDHFTGLERGATRLSVAGKVHGAGDAQWCLDHGADAVLVGSGAILQRDFAARALADREYRAPDQPVSRDHLAGEAVGERFVDYLATQWDDFVR